MFYSFVKVSYYKKIQVPCSQLDLPIISLYPLMLMSPLFKEETSITINDIVLFWPDMLK